MDIRGPVSHSLLDEKVNSTDDRGLSDCFSGDPCLSYPCHSASVTSGDLTELFFNLSANPVVEVNHLLDILKSTEHRLNPFHC